MSPGTARTVMRSQRLGKHGSGMRRNGLLEEMALARYAAPSSALIWAAYLDPAFPPICSIVSRQSTVLLGRDVVSKIQPWIDLLHEARYQGPPVLRDQVRMESTGGGV